MADRYWVGGTASWDGTAGTKWATTSGGAGGASVPTSADDVFFTDLSTGTVTIATGNTGAKSINCTGFTGTITGTGTITIAGSITLVSGMTYTHDAAITITATATLTTAGKSLGFLTINAPGGTVTLADALTLAPLRPIVVTAGTFDTAGYNVTANLFNSQGAATRTIFWRTSTVTLLVSNGNATSIQGSNITFNAGTSTLVLTGNQPSLSNNDGGLGLTFYDVNFTSTASTGVGLSPGTTHNNITIAAPAAAGICRATLQGNITVNGTLSFTGTTPTTRGGFLSNTLGSPRTMTVATLSTSHCDFQDVTIVGAASPATPTGAGNCGGNTNITFPTAKTVYKVGTGTTWGDASGWASSSGGTPTSADFPLVQDTAIVDNATTGTSLTFANYSRGALNMSSRTTATTLNASVAASFYGSFILGSGVTVSGTSSQTYAGRSTSTFTTAGKTLTFGLSVSSIGGGIVLGDAFGSINGIALNNGTFSAGTYNVTISSFFSSNSNVRTLNMGSGLWTVTDTGTVWELSISTNLTLNRGTADILLSSTGTTLRVFSGGGRSYNKLTIGGATGTANLRISGVNTFTEIASTKTVAHTIRLVDSGGTIGVWSVKGTAGNVVTLNSLAAGTRQTINLTNVTSGIDYLAVQDIGVTQPNRFYVGANSTNDGNNVNVIFTDPPAPDTTRNMFMMFVQ